MIFGLQCVFSGSAKLTFLDRGPVLLRYPASGRLFCLKDCISERQRSCRGLFVPPDPPTGSPRAFPNSAAHWGGLGRGQGSRLPRLRIRSSFGEFARQSPGSRGNDVRARCSELPSPRTVARLPVQPELWRDVFSYFFMGLSAKTPTFESISGRESSKKTFKSRCFR